MKNVTISMDEELIQSLRVEAAKAGKSMSKYVSQLVEKSLGNGIPAQRTNNLQLEALARIKSRPAWNVSENGKMPTAEERNARY